MSKKTPEAVETTEATTEAPVARQRLIFNFPVADDIKNVRPETLRAAIIARLQPDGATFEELVEVTKAFDERRGKVSDTTHRRTYEALRILHFTIGYGMRQTDDGKIFLVT